MADPTDTETTAAPNGADGNIQLNSSESTEAATGEPSAEKPPEEREQQNAGSEDATVQIAAPVPEAAPADEAASEAEAPEDAQTEEEGDAEAPAEQAASSDQGEAAGEDRPPSEESPTVASGEEAIPAETPTSEQGSVAVKAQAGEQPAAAEAEDEKAPEESSTVTQQAPEQSATEATSAPEKAEAAALSPALLAIAEKYRDGERVTGRVIGWNKGGFHISMEGEAAFCPRSQMELGHPKKAAAYVDREMDFKVLELREGGKRVVLTRKPVLHEDRKKTVDMLSDKVKSGEPISGRVCSITEFGAFVDVGGGVEGLVHLTQLSRRRVESASDVVKVGDVVQLKVLKIEKGGQRVSLSMKALEADPWNDVADRFEVATTFEGKVVRKTDFGLFVDLGEGIEGLLHSSQLETGKRLDDHEVGNEVSGWIKEVTPSRRRISLTQREIPAEDPWKTVNEKYPEGSEVQGTVEEVTRFGVFIALEPGLTGLLPFSALNMPAGSHARHAYRNGQSVNVQIGERDRKRKRLSLVPVGTQLEGTRSDLNDYKKKQTKASDGLNAMAAAFARLQE